MLHAEYITTVNDYKKRTNVGESLSNSLHDIIPTALCKEKIYLTNSIKTNFNKDFEEVVFCNLSVGSCVGNLKMVTRNEK